MERINKIKNEDICIEETINKEDNIEFIKQKLKDKEVTSIKKAKVSILNY